MKEIWKDIVGYEGHYKVSNLGRVKSLKFNDERILSLSKNPNGYYKVNLCKNNNFKTRLIHHLVAESFLNHKTKGHKLVIDHINNNKSDNRLGNLQLISSRDNSNKDKKGTSKYRGVRWHKRDKRWATSVVFNGVNYHLGNFKTELRASIAYELALLQLDKFNKILA